MAIFINEFCRTVNVGSVNSATIFINPNKRIEV
jgi:hypothetical protein